MTAQGTQSSLPVTFEEICKAHDRIRPFVHRTPVMTCRTLDEQAGCQVFMKCENFQRTGAFKFRGAMHAVLRLSEEQRAKGVVTHSSGNHAQALALAGRLEGVRVRTVIPQNAPAVKLEAAKGYGARIIPCAPTQKSREETAARIVREEGAILIPSASDPRIIEGQGTAAKEFIEDCPDLEVLLAPVGGGGLISGTTLTAAGQKPGLQVIGCEPMGADDAYRSLESGTRITQQDPRTVADGLRVLLGALPFQILRHHRVPITRVSEEEILGALQFIWERAKLLIEPSSAVAVAPLLRNDGFFTGKKVGIILSGGNINARKLFSELKI